MNPQDDLPEINVWGDFIRHSLYLVILPSIIIPTMYFIDTYYYKFPSSHWIISLFLSVFCIKIIVLHFCYICYIELQEREQLRKKFGIALPEEYCYKKNTDFVKYETEINTPSEQKESELKSDNIDLISNKNIRNNTLISETCRDLKKNTLIELSPVDQARNFNIESLQNKYQMSQELSSNFENEVNNTIVESSSFSSVESSTNILYSEDASFDPAIATSYSFNEMEDKNNDNTQETNVD